jgi:hydroxyacylglutathione hydrolase
MSGNRNLETGDGDLVIRTVAVGPLRTNCYLLIDGPTHEAILIDPGDEPGALLDAAADVHVGRIVLTHSHWDHVLGLPEIADALGAPVHLHAADADVWPHERAFLERHGHFDAGTATAELLACGCALRPDPHRPAWDGDASPLGDGAGLRFGSQQARVVHTPGHTPGGISLVVGAHVFTGDTLFPGGPGLTGWPLSDFPTIIESIRGRLFGLPDATVVHPGHGATTTIGAERPHLQEWIARGW